MTKDEALDLALEALEESKTNNDTMGFWDRKAKAITAIKEALAQPEQEPVATIDSLEQEIYENTREFVSLNVMEWLLKRLNTIPPAQEFVCSTGLCHFTLTQTNVGIGERGMEAYEAAKERGWVGVSDERLMEMSKQKSEKRECMNCAAFGECNPNNDTGRCGHEPPAAQRQWTGLTDEEWQDLSDRYGMILFGRFKNEIETKLREKNTP